jgi:Sec-independent protein secretion pathway component TatC
VLFGAVVFAVVITPGGDPISPIVLAGTMYALFELTIMLLTRRRRAMPDLLEASDA